jgi:hypothetical protein
MSEDAMKFLEGEDQKYGKNSSANPETPTKTELGRAASATIESSIAGSNDGYWKTIPLENLPSKGLFYAEGSELTIRSATVSEIRQWSTIDESDMLDVDDKLNFILEKCTRFKIKGGSSWLTWRDILEVDRLYIIFVIHEITFPNGENELFTKFECTDSCAEDGKFNDQLLVRSEMLQIFELPEEITEWYSNQYRCFEVISKKLNETFYLYMPTVGVVERLRKRISEERGANRRSDKAFIKVAPYIIQDWSNFGKDDYVSIHRDSMGWHVNKFSFITKFAEKMESARYEIVSTTCPKCGAKLTNPLFSRGSFTLKDFFLISGRLNELV